MLEGKKYQDLNLYNSYTVSKFPGFSPYEIEKRKTREFQKPVNIKLIQVVLTFFPPTHD